MKHQDYDFWNEHKPRVEIKKYMPCLGLGKGCKKNILTTSESRFCNSCQSHKQRFEIGENLKTGKVRGPRPFQRSKEKL